MTMSRRDLVLTGGVALALPAQARGQANRPEGKGGAGRRLKVVVAGGHPGDPEYGCGGTVARLTDKGHEVVLLYLNNGAWPPTDAAVRTAEAKAACATLKARPAYAGQTNGAAVVDGTSYDHYLSVLQAEAPDAVFTHWPLDTHRDHRATANLCFDAWQRGARKFALYYYEVSVGEDTVQFAPNRYVDISTVQTRKRAACFAHASQTPDRYFAMQDQIAMFRGAESGNARAEAFLWQQGSPFDILAVSADGTQASL